MEQVRESSVAKPTKKLTPEQKLTAKREKEAKLRKKAHEIVGKLSGLQQKINNDFDSARKCEGLIGDGGLAMSDGDIAEELNRIVREYDL